MSWHELELSGTEESSASESISTPSVSARSTSMAAAHAFLQKQEADFKTAPSATPTDDVNLTPDRLANIEVMAWPERDLLFRLRPTWQVLDLSRFSRAKDVLTALRDHSLSRDGLFEMVWGKNLQSPDEHQAAIFAVLLRIRKRLGVRLQTSRNRIALDNTIVLADFAIWN